MTDKQRVREFWDEASCGERLYLEGRERDDFERQAVIRYALEPFIVPFAQFERFRDRDVLEIGVGLGADHQRFAEAGARLSGIDLTPRAIELTRRRFDALGLESDLRVGDAENLEYSDASFDLVYSWGVIHHSPDTARAVGEIHRVLRPGGTAKVMIYNKYSLVGLMLWTRYALLRGRPFMPLADVYAKHLESPGTKAYTETEARALFRSFVDVKVTVVLGHGDLLMSQAGQRHAGPLLSAARRVWPRWLLRRVCRGNGLFMLIEGVKGA